MQMKTLSFSSVLSDAISHFLGLIVEVYTFVSFVKNQEQHQYLIRLPRFVLSMLKVKCLLATMDGDLKM